ncbi:MAG: hypothetical protein ACR2N5_05920 [Solirubrobacterales bacterium]
MRSASDRNEQVPEPSPLADTVAAHDSANAEAVLESTEETATSATVGARARGRLVARVQTVYVRLRNVGDVLVWLGGPVVAGLRFGRRWALRASWRRWGPGILAALERRETHETDAEHGKTDPEE